MRSRLADYQIIGPAGPEGDSWLAETPARLGGGATVVVTQLDERRSSWPAFSEQLRALAAVRSPYLPRLIEAGCIDEDGVTVRWVTREDGRPADPGGAAPDVGVALRRLAAAARGAHDLHEAGWAHGDIHPRSVLQRGGDTLLEPPVRTVARAGAVTPPGIRAGDLDTVEPALLWGEGASRATDIGATAHRVLTGHHVHPALDDDLVVTAVRRVLAEAPVMDSTLEPATASLLRSCLAADPAERPPTAADLADDLEQLAAGR